MEALVELEQHCPHCGAFISLLVDTSLAQQDYIEDCEVCCAPIRIVIHIDESIRMDLYREA